MNVPRYATDQFCSGPCLVETQLVLNCINNVLSNFIFYNTATIKDIRYALHGGCSFTSQRGKLALFVGWENWWANISKELRKIVNKFFVLCRKLQCWRLYSRWNKQCWLASQWNKLAYLGLNCWLLFLNFIFFISLSEWILESKEWEYLETEQIRKGPYTNPITKFLFTTY